MIARFKSSVALWNRARLAKRRAKIAKAADEFTPQVAAPVVTFNPLYTMYSTFDATGLIKKYTLSAQDPAPGVVTNFLGVKVSPSVMPSMLTSMVGTVEAPPEPGNWHADIAEWASALRCVDLANDMFQIVEVGCGWGCWMNNMGVVARRRGLNLRLVGVEGDEMHIESAKATLALNGFTPDQWVLKHGIAAERTGTSFFPLVENAAETWGGEAVFFPQEDEAERLRDGGRYVELACYDLALLSDGNMIDLLHIDIQGAEVAFVNGNIANMDKTVKRCLVGTHSREIDGALITAFLKAGWMLELERPTIHEIVHGRPSVRIDGVQLWKNPALAA